MQTVETILGNKPSIRKAILLEYAKTPDGIPVKRIDEKLGVSGLDKNHLKKLEELGILEICHIEVSRPSGRFRTETVCMDKGYRLKQDPDTFAKLLRVFIGTKYIDDFVISAYIETIDNQDLKHIGLEFVVEQVNAALFVATAFVPEADIRWLLNTIVNVRSEVKHNNEAHPRYLDDPSIRHRYLCRRLTAACRSEYLREP